MRLNRKVVRASPYALFFEIEEGIDGVLHVDDMSWTKKIRNASSFAKVDEQVEVMVIGIDKERGKVQLGVKQLSEDPWESIARAYPRGSIISGEITNITDFGFFVRVQGGIEGLVHKMNVVDDRVEPVETAMAKYKVGDQVQAVVTEVSPSKQKLSLSLKDYVKRVQREEMDKYIHDDSKQETVSLGDMLKDKIKG
jgi:small subunit ribosomal protein S1